ncbi:MAG: M2 family metallopeptidase [Bacteroidales bacterium]
MKKLFYLLFTFGLLNITACKNETVELQKLLTKIESEVQPMRAESALAQWNGSVSGKEEDFAKSAALQQKMTEYFSNKETFAKLKQLKESGKITDSLLLRQLDIVYNLALSNQADTTLLKQIIKKSVHLEKVYGEYRAQLNGEPINDNQVEDILKNSTNNKELEQVWNSHKGIGKLVEKDIIELVKLRNKVAQSLGFDNFHTMTLKLSGQDPAEVSAIFDELDNLTSASFAQLKDEMDEVFAKRYKVKKEDLMPWHFQGRYFQEAPNLYPVDLDKYYAGKNLETLTGDFYTSVGLETASILQNSSLYPQEGKNQHAFSTDIDGKGDIRILCNLASNEQWMGTMLHEFGHGVYSKGHDSNSNLPYFLREAAHPFTTEGVAMLFERFSRHAGWMQRSLNLTNKEREEIQANCVKATRLQQVVLCRWNQVMYRFEKEMYANPDQDLNALWWTLVEKYQRLKKPEGRNEPDYATKIHVALYPCYYHNYQLGELFASQMHHYIVNNVTKTGNIKDDYYFGNKEVGNWLQTKIFSPGMTYQWNNLIQKATGEKLTAKYYAEQFELNKVD